MGWSGSLFVKNLHIQGNYLKWWFICEKNAYSGKLFKDGHCKRKQG